MKNLIHRYATQFTDKRFIVSLATSLALLVGSLIANYYAVTYAVERVSNPVTDIVLSNIPVFDVNWFFTYGAIIFWAIIIFICLSDPKKLPFMLKTVALFVVVRSLFITLTHIGPYPDQLPLGPNGTNFFDDFGYLINTFLSSLFTSSADQFFSGHTGLPFLLALIFWNDQQTRFFCLASAVFFGAIVLMGHLHYSIDVIAAFFITYSIYHIAEKAFARDRANFFGKSVS